MKKTWKILAVLALSGLFGVVMAQTPPPMPVVDPPGHNLPLEGVVIDFETVATPACSEIVEKDANTWQVKVVVGYTASTWSVITCKVFDENNDAFASAVCPAGVEHHTPDLGTLTGTVVFTYDVPKNTAWGQDITSRDFDQAWVVVTMERVNVIDTDEGWVYRPAP